MRNYYAKILCKEEDIDRFSYLYQCTFKDRIGVCSLKNVSLSKDHISEQLKEKLRKNNMIMGGINNVAI